MSYNNDQLILIEELKKGGLSMETISLLIPGSKKDIENDIKDQKQGLPFAIRPQEVAAAKRSTKIGKTVAWMGFYSQYGFVRIRKEGIVTAIYDNYCAVFEHGKMHCVQWGDIALAKKLRGRERYEY